METDVTKRWTTCCPLNPPASSQVCSGLPRPLFALARPLLLRRLFSRSPASQKPFWTPCPGPSDAPLPTPGCLDLGSLSCFAVVKTLAGSCPLHRTLLTRLRFPIPAQSKLIEKVNVPSSSLPSSAWHAAGDNCPQALEFLRAFSFLASTSFQGIFYSEDGESVSPTARGRNTHCPHNAFSQTHSFLEPPQHPTRSAAQWVSAQMVMLRKLLLLRVINYLLSPSRESSVFYENWWNCQANLLACKLDKISDPSESVSVQGIRMGFWWRHSFWTRKYEGFTRWQRMWGEFKGTGRKHGHVVEPPLHCLLGERAADQVLGPRRIFQGSCPRCCQLSSGLKDLLTNLGAASGLPHCKHSTKRSQSQPLAALRVILV